MYYIYSVTNLDNHKVYIGQTKQDPRHRWDKHSSKSKNPQLIQRAIQKHGKDAFLFRVIDSALTESDANIKERLYIHFFKCIVPNGYNLTTGGHKRFKLSEDQKRQRSETQKKNAKKHPIKVKNLQTNEIYNYESIYETGRQLNIRVTRIFHALKRKDRTYRHYAFFNIDENIPKTLPHHLPFAKYLKVIDKVNGDIYYFKSCYEASQKLKLHRATVERWTTRNTKSKKYICEQITEHEYLIQANKESYNERC